MGSVDCYTPQFIFYILSFLILKLDDPPAFSFLNLESTKLSPPLQHDSAKPSKSTNSVKNDYLVEPTDLAKKEPR